MSSVVSSAAESLEATPEASIDVAWVGPRPTWLELDDAAAELAGIRLQETVTGADVVHVVASAVRRTNPDAIQRSRLVVLDASERRLELGWRERRVVRAADVLLIGSRAELRELWDACQPVAQKAVVFRPPVDLSAHAPLKRLHATRDAEIKRFRRIHRLAGPMVLFAGPYTKEGGLDVVLGAVYRLRERHPELRLAAVPHGAVDEGYRDRCERRALALGHHGIIEWAPTHAELPLWYALAMVVCMPVREPAAAVPLQLAAAAGRPCVVSDIDGLAELVDEGETGYVVPPGDAETLAAALQALLEDTEAAERMGATALAKAQEDLAPAVAARRLRRLWTDGGATATIFADGGAALG